MSEKGVILVNDFIDGQFRRWIFGELSQKDAAEITSWLEIGQKFNPGDGPIDAKKFVSITVFAEATNLAYGRLSKIQAAALTKFVDTHPEYRTDFDDGERMVSDLG